MKVVHIISSLSRGGRERQLATIYKYSEKRKVDMKIACFNRTDNSYIGEYNMGGDVIFLNAQTNFGRFFELRRIVKAQQISIVWTWGSIESTLGILLSLFGRVKHINGSVRHGIVLSNFSHTWRKMMLHLSRNIVSNSLAGLQANSLKRGYVMYNGLDKQFILPHEADLKETKKKLGIGDNTICLLSVANLVPYKDYKTILRALYQVKQSGTSFHYFIIGEGPDRLSIESLIKEINLTNDVTLLGRQSDVKHFLQFADIFIHSSRGEGCSNAILEAMAAGLPVVASDTGGTSEIIDDTVGRLFEYKNAVQLTLRLNELIQSAEIRKTLCLNSVAKVKFAFSIERMMHDYYSILESVNKQ